MSDIGFDGVGSFLIGLVFLGLGALLLLIVAAALGIRAAMKKQPLGHPAILGMAISAVLLGGCGGLAMLAADEWPRGTDDMALIWGPGALLFAIVGGIATGVLSKGRRTETG